MFTLINNNLVHNNLFLLRAPMDQETIIELRDGYIYAESFGVETLERSTAM